MADGNKAADQSGEIEAKLVWILASFERANALLGEITATMDRIIARPLPGAAGSDRLSGYVADVLKEAHEQRVTRAMLDHLVRDLRKIRDDTATLPSEVYRLDRRVKDLEKLVRELAGDVDKVMGRGVTAGKELKEGGR